MGSVGYGHVWKDSNFHSHMYSATLTITSLAVLLSIANKPVYVLAHKCAFRHPRPLH